MSQLTDDVITAPEAARLKGVAESSIRRAIQEGRLPGVRKGHVYLVRRGDLDAWQPIGHRPTRSASESRPQPAVRHQTAGRETSHRAASQGTRSPTSGKKQALRDRAIARAARIKALQQEFVDLSISTEEFLREKHEDIEWEEQGGVA